MARPELATPELATPELATPELATPELATPELATRLLMRLEVSGRARIPLAELLSAWAAEAPHLQGSSEQLAELSVTLGLLEADGRLRLPAAGSWDRSSRPVLPRFVTVVRAPKARADSPWRTVPWRPELGWAASLPTLTPAQLAALRAVNTWLATPAARGPAVPARLRSAELFGDEKFLDSLASSTLFGPGRLSYALMACRRLAPPMASTRVGAGLDVLVVENADPYWALVDIVRDLAGPIGTVAWGAGKAVEQSVTSLWESGPVGTAWYWGDLDPEGVLLAGRAAARVAASGLGVMRPHAGLWTAMAALPATGSGIDWSGVDGRWLGASWEATQGVRDVGGRVAQERLGLGDLRAALG